MDLSVVLAVVRKLQYKSNLVGINEITHVWPVHRSMSVLIVGAVMMGIMIGLGLKDAKLIRTATLQETPTRSTDYQNVFVKPVDVYNTSAPLVLAKSNLTGGKGGFFPRRSSFGRRNATAKAEMNLDRAKATFGFEQARTLAAKLRGDIHEYWQIDSFPKFKNTMHIPKAQWETYKKKFEYLLSHPNSTKSFTIAFGGSSVTAGHDNFLAESYPSLVRQQLSPIFSLMGIKLQVCANVAAICLSVCNCTAAVSAAVSMNTHYIMTW